MGLQNNRNQSQKQDLSLANIRKLSFAFSCYSSLFLLQIAGSSKDLLQERGFRLGGAGVRDYAPLYLLRDFRNSIISTIFSLSSDDKPENPRKSNCVSES